jgi:hypothetical protein
LVRKLEIPHFIDASRICDKGACPDKKALYILSWVGGVWGGIRKIYRAIWFNVNANYTRNKNFVKDFFCWLFSEFRSVKILKGCEAGI